MEAMETHDFVGVVADAHDAQPHFPVLLDSDLRACARCQHSLLGQSTQGRGTAHLFVCGHVARLIYGLERQILGDKLRRERRVSRGNRQRRRARREGRQPRRT